MPLTDIKIRNLKPDVRVRRLSDGENLFIEVRPSGTKLFKMAYTYRGKQKTLSLGIYPHVSLAKARMKKIEAKALLADDIDPMAHKQEMLRQEQIAVESTFAFNASELLAKDKSEGKAPSTLKKRRWLLDMASSQFGNMAMDDISAAEVLNLLRSIEEQGNFETAKRLRMTVGQVFRHAICSDRASTNPTEALHRALASPKVRHMAALTDPETFAQLVRAVWEYPGGSLEIRTALKLMVLLFPRPGELRLAMWPEFDLKAATWTIPMERVKQRRIHKKPLSQMAVQLLQELRENGSQQDYVFASTFSRGRPISENTMNVALRRMGFSKDEATSHGFRASASTLLNECGQWNPDAIEAELSHQERNQVRAAYHRSTYWEERVRMADYWSERVSEMVEQLPNRGDC